MKKMTLRFLGVPVALALCITMGCASTPNFRFYTLDMQASGDAEIDVHVVVDRLRASDALARLEILIQKSPTQIEYYAQDQWAAGVGSLVREKLLSEFGDSAPADAPTLTLTGEILSFGQVDTSGGAEAHVKIEIVVERADGDREDRVLLNKVYEARRPAASARPVEVVQALSETLESIAAQIASDLRDVLK